MLIFFGIILFTFIIFCSWCLYGVFETKPRRKDQTQRSQRDENNGTAVKNQREDRREYPDEDDGADEEDESD